MKKSPLKLKINKTEFDKRIVSKKFFRMDEDEYEDGGSFYRSVVRFEPSRRVIKVGRANIYLSFPSICFSIDYIKDAGRYELACFRVAFANNKKDLKSLYYPSFPNTSPHDFNVCLGGFYGSFKSPKLLIQKAIETFWQTEFYEQMTFDYMGQRGRNKILADYAKWQAKTFNDKNWVPSIKDMTRANSKGVLAAFNLK